MNKICAICQNSFDARGHSKTCSEKCSIELNRLQKKAYSQTDKSKTSRKAYSQTPEHNEYMKAYKQSNEHKAYQKAYREKLRGEKAMPAEPLVK